MEKDWSNLLSQMKLLFIFYNEEYINELDLTIQKIGTVLLKINVWIVLEINF